MTLLDPGKANRCPKELFLKVCDDIGCKEQGKKLFKWFSNPRNALNIVRNARLKTGGNVCRARIYLACQFRYSLYGGS